MRKKVADVQSSFQRLGSYFFLYSEPTNKSPNICVMLENASPSRVTETRKKILCIEDDRETAALVAEELVDRGFAVTVAHDGREGLAAILKIMPDLVLSDISMPLM